MTSPTPAAAEAMDNIYRYQRFIYDATRAYYLLGRNRMIAGLDVPADGTVLEIGCGTGRNLLHTARRYPKARLYGFDISAAMLETAANSIARQNLNQRIAITAGDATNFDAQQIFGRAEFDRVFISYTLSMIPAWESVVTGAARCVAPGGSLSIVDFGDFASYPAILRRLQLAWLRRFSVKPVPALEARLGALAAEAGLTADSVRLFGGYAILSHLSRPPAC